MKTLTLVAALLALFSAPLGATPQHEASGPFEVELVRVNGDLLCTLVARDAPVQAMVSELAERAGLEVDGLRHVPAEAEATVRLERRPLDQVLQYLLGAFDVRSSTTSQRILLRPELPPFAAESDLLDAADLAYRRALKYDPNSVYADRAEFALGRIQVRRGNIEAALGHWDILADQYKESPLVPEALFRGAEIRVAEGRWADAALELSELIELETPHDFAMSAHRLLALCTTQVGNHQRALYHLDALDKQFPPETGEELARRNFIRARAHIGLGDAGTALRLLDRRESRLYAGDHPGERIELLAAAMQAAGRPGDASIAWLEYAGRASGTEQGRAYGLAAELALEARDELSAILIAESAGRDGHTAAVERVLHEARLRLDLPETTLSGRNASERVTLAERLLRDGLLEEARTTAAPLAGLRGSLEVDLLMRFTSVYARALAASPGGIETAIAEIRLTLPRLEDIEQRSKMYLLAGSLLEAAGLFDRSIEAYRGRL